jgi:hypothetical protein
MNTRIREHKKFTVRESYRRQVYVGVVSLDSDANSWAWKGHVDFNEGLHTMFTNRAFPTAKQAEEHMRQFAHQCIDNRLDGR